ncbi:AAA family ATPase [Candidatus Micrarchaeota archaeon]|nr:AAA family ATPase [Candidatus Micrarchaeota archaeon]
MDVQPIERAATGIYGLDDLLEGGFPRGRTILISGACGTGKSIFCTQFLVKGAIEQGEPGVLVSFDETPHKIRQDMLRFGWNLNALEQKGLFTILDATSARAGAPSEEENALLPGQLDMDKVLIDILTLCRRVGAKRLVIDSIPAMGQQLEREGDIRKTILKLSYILSRAGLTTLITSEIEEQSIGSGRSLTFSKYAVEEYVADGVLLLNFLGIGSSEVRTMYIRKMRGTKHSTNIHPMEINEKGMTVHKIENVFK